MINNKYKKLFCVAAICLSSCFLQAQNNKVIAHRGAWKTNHLPENSIASLQAAIREGFAGSEFDVHLTADDSLVINHDNTFDGVNIQKSSFAKLMQHKLANGEPIPTLRQYLTADIHQDKTKLVLEIKPSIVGPERAMTTVHKILALVKEMKALNKIIFISFDYNMLKEIIKLYPKAKTQYLDGNKSPEQLKADGITGADYYYTVFQQHPDWVKEAHKLGIKLNAWTVNKPEVMDWLLSIGIDAITTNEPELALQREKRYEKLYAGKKLVYSKEFNEKGLPNTDDWKYDTGHSGWGNNEWQNYTANDSNTAFIKNGCLQIVAQKNGKDNYTSARLVTKQAFKYGRIEIRAMLPKGRGLWPAIWMLPAKNDYGKWPRSGEIDIMEHVGYNPDSVFFSAHTEKYNHIIHTQKTTGAIINSPYTQFHVFALERTKDALRFYMDDSLMFTYTNEHSGWKAWPFHKPFNLILNIAIGGNWGGKEGVDDTVFPATMKVDYVRFYEE